MINVLLRLIANNLYYKNSVWIPSRYIFTALVSMGLAIIYGLKVHFTEDQLL